MDNVEMIRVEIPASLKYLHVLSAAIVAIFERIPDLQEVEAHVYNLSLAVQELGTNIVTHAYGGEDKSGRIEVVFTLTSAPRRLIIETLDSGRGQFDPENVSPPSMQEPQDHGYGLFLMRELLDEISYQLAPGDNRWRLVKDLG